MKIFGKEPVVWLSLLAALLVAIYTQVTTPGIVVDGNNGQTIANIILVIAPVIAGFVSRNFVTPTSVPTLPTGTAVTVTAPGTAATTTTTV